MLWVYVLLLTAGLVAIVPTVLRAIDGLPSDTLMGAVGFGGLFSGTVGLILRFADLNGTATFIAAAVIGLGASALHPELVGRLRPDADAHSDAAEDAEPDGGFRVDKPQSTRGSS